MCFEKIHFYRTEVRVVRDTANWQNLTTTCAVTAEELRNDKIILITEFIYSSEQLLFGSNLLEGEFPREKLHFEANHNDHV